MSTLPYHIVSFITPINQQTTTQDKLDRLGCLGFEESFLENEKIQWKTYWQGEQVLSELLQKILQAIPHINKIIQTDTIGLRAAEEHSFDPYCFVEPFWIVPASALASNLSKCLPPKIPISLNSGPAFGSGLHPTTQLVGELFLQWKKQNLHSVLDVGTGSGILAILAAYFKPQNIDVVEIEAHALKLAQENFAINSIEVPVQYFSSVEKVANNYSLIFANLLTPVLLKLKATLLHCLEPKGQLYFSGIFESELETFLNHFSELKVVDTQQKQGWWGVVLEKNKRPQS